MLHRDTEIYVIAEKSALRAHAARKSNSQFGLILLKNSCLIGCAFADSIPLLNGGLSDDGSEAGSTASAVLCVLA